MKTFLAVLLEKIRFQACGAQGGQRLRSGVAAQQQTHMWQLGEAASVGILQAAGALVWASQEISETTNGTSTAIK